jgi:hypothetical protein
VTVQTILIVKNLWLVGFALTVSAATASANLGETLEQSIQRYGPVLKQSQSEHLPNVEAARLYEFARSGFQIQARFVNKKCAWISYLKVSPIFDVEIHTLLENNAEGSTWSPEVPDRFSKKKIKYQRADALADATYEELGSYHGLSIITKVWRHATSAASDL